MEKYVVTSGNVVIITWSEDADGITFEASNKHTPIKFKTIGEAMTIASKVNNLIGSNLFKIVSIYE